MRIAYISHGNIPSQWAHTVQSMKMAEAFASHQEDFTLLTGINRWNLLRPRFDFESWYGVRRRFKITRLTVRGFPRKRIYDHVFSEEFSSRAVAWCERNGVDFIYTRTPIALPACVASGIPFAFESHHLHDDERMELLKRHAHAANLTAIITITDYVRNRLTSLGLPEEKMLVFPDAVDLDQFDSVDESRRTAFGLPAGVLTVGYCGHLYEDRGVKEIIHAAKRLPHAQFVLAGGWEHDVAKWRENTAGLDNVRFTGHLNHADVPSFLKSCDCLLMPYSARCATAPAMSPMKMFEYMAAERPIIASDLPAIRTVLRHEENSLLASPDDGDALADAVSRLERDGKFGTLLANTAREEVGKFTWSARARAVLDFVEQRLTVRRPKQEMADVKPDPGEAEPVLNCS